MTTHSLEKENVQKQNMLKDIEKENAAKKQNLIEVTGTDVKVAKRGDWLRLENVDEFSTSFPLGGEITYSSKNLSVLSFDSFHVVVTPTSPVVKTFEKTLQDAYMAIRGSTLTIKFQRAVLASTLWKKLSDIGARVITIVENSSNNFAFIFASEDSARKCFNKLQGVEFCDHRIIGNID